MKNTNKKGFTLIELLVVLAIIAILTGVVFVALDPLSRFNDSDDARRAQDVTAIADALALYLVDNEGVALTAVATDGDYMVTFNGSTIETTNTCANGTTTDGAADLQTLVDDNYLPGAVVAPSDSANAADWDTGTSEGSGYTVNVDGSKYTVTACDVEGDNTNYVGGISVTR